MSIDLQTLALFLTITNFLQFIALFAEYRINKAISGLGWWAVGSAVLALGFAFNYLREIPALELIAIVANNALFISGFALVYVGARVFFGQPVQRRRLFGFCLAVTLISIYFTYFQNDLVLRRINIYFSVAILSYLIARTLFVHKARSVTASANFLASIFVAFGFIFALFTLILGLSASIPGGGIFTPVRLQTAMYLISLLFSTMWTFGLIIMINQRINVEIREAKENSELIFNTSPDAVLITRLSDGQFININEGFTALTGYTRADVMGKTVQEINIWKNPADRQKLITALTEHGFCENLQAVFLCKDGRQPIGMVSARVILLQDIPYIISVTRDVTHQRQVEDEKKKTDDWLRLLSLAIEQSPVSIVITDLTGNIVFTNPKFSETTGYTSEEVLGKNPRILKTEETPGSKHKDLWKTLLAGQSWHGIFRNRKKNGELYWESSVISPVKDALGNTSHFLSVQEDITERKRLEEELHQRATTDELTGVFNRRHLLELASGEIKRAIRLKHPMAIALIDIDRFKHINDTYGHAAGDQVLLTFTKICQKNIRAIDVFARFGGDEFVLLLPETSLAQACEVVERIRVHLMAQPVEFGDRLMPVTISSGISGLASDLETLDSLMERADQALYQAKEAGRNCVRVEHS